MHYIDIGGLLKKHELNFMLFPDLWRSFAFDKIDLNLLEWREVKFLNELGNDVSDEIKNLPNNKGGLYLFIIKCPILPKITEYLVYIGRAQLTEYHNLRIRVNKYFNEYIRDDQRPKITRIIHQWQNELFIRYIELDDNELIKELEADLINKILPPGNDEIPDKNIKSAVKAFNL